MLFFAPLSLLIFGAWTYSQELIISETNAKFLAKPHSLPVEAINHFRYKLTAVEVTMRVDHQAIAPSWWGESKNLSFVPRDLIYVDSADKKWEIFYNRTRFRFDKNKHQYVVVFEGLVPFEGHGATGRIVSNFKVERRANKVGSFPVDLSISKNLSS